MFMYIIFLSISSFILIPSLNLWHKTYSVTRILRLAKEQGGSFSENTKLKKNQSF